MISYAVHRRNSAKCQIHIAVHFLTLLYKQRKGCLAISECVVATVCAEIYWARCGYNCRAHRRMKCRYICLSLPRSNLPCGMVCISQHYCRDRLTCLYCSDLIDDAMCFFFDVIRNIAKIKWLTFASATLYRRDSIRHFRRHIGILRR